MSPEIPKTGFLEKEVFSIQNEESFHSIALQVFHFQYQNNPVYRRFSDALGRHPGHISKIEQIPFLPVSFFKTNQIQTTPFDPELVFESSGTTGSRGSFHHIKKADLYEESFLRGFTSFFGPPENFCILGLLPSYLEKGNSSLVYMIDKLIKWSSHPLGGFYLHDHEKLQATIAELEKAGQKTVLFGVSYALLDYSERFSSSLKHTSIIETGGMKGRRKELSKPELYERLKKGFGTKSIYSEYGMTELLSQAYAVDGMYTCPPWLKILIRDESDPLHMIQQVGKTGVINVIDLANLYSCSFLATDDAGRLMGSNSFEVIGRVDNSDIRGCSLMLVNE